MVSKLRCLCVVAPVSIWLPIEADGLGYTTKCVAFLVTFRCFGAEKSGFKLMCLLGRYESSRLPCVRPVNESQWKNVCWTSQVEVSGV